MARGKGLKKQMIFSLAHRCLDHQVRSTSSILHLSRLPLSHYHSHSTVASIHVRRPMEPVGEHQTTTRVKTDSVRSAILKAFVNFEGTPQATIPSQPYRVLTPEFFDRGASSLHHAQRRNGRKDHRRHVDACREELLNQLFGGTDR